MNSCIPHVCTISASPPLTFRIGTQPVPAFNLGFLALFFVKRSEEHTSELQSPCNIVCRLLLEKKNYTRFSSDLQRDISIGDQIALCKRYAERENIDIIMEFADRAKSGASMVYRDQLLELMHAV